MSVSQDSVSNLYPQTKAEAFQDLLNVFRAFDHKAPPNAERNSSEFKSYFDALSTPVKILSYPKNFFEYLSPSMVAKTNTGSVQRRVLNVWAAVKKGLDPYRKLSDFNQIKERYFNNIAQELACKFMHIRKKSSDVDTIPMID